MHGVNISISDYGVACIGGNCNCNQGMFSMLKNAILTIGADLIVNPGFIFSVNANTRVCVGKDCLFSYNVSIFSNDGHSIFDERTGEKLNDALQKSRAITIGEHVWVGVKTTILYDTVIGNGSIIGANSLVKGKFKEHCMLAGNPAKMIRENVVWNKDE